MVVRRPRFGCSPASKDTAPRRPSHQGRTGEPSPVHGQLPTPGDSAPARKAHMAPSVPGHALIAGSRSSVPPVLSVVNPRLSLHHNNGLELVHAQGSTSPDRGVACEMGFSGRSLLLWRMRFGLIDRGVADRRAQNHSKAKPDEGVQTLVARLSGRAASCATTAYAVRAAEIVPTH